MSEPRQEYEVDTQQPEVPMQSNGLDPKKPVFYLIPQDLMQQVINRLGKQKAAKVHGLLNALNQCRAIQPEIKPDG